MHFTTLYRNVTKRSTRSDTSNTQLKIEDEFKSLLPLDARYVLQFWIRGDFWIPTNFGFVFGKRGIRILSAI